MMQCSNMVLWVAARRKGSGDPFRKIKKNSWHSWWSTYLKVEQAEGLVPCEGRVKIEIETSYGNGCCDPGGTSIVYECDACGCPFYPELPQNAGDLEDLLNEGFVTKARNKKMREAHVKGYEEAEERMKKFREESDARIAKNRARGKEERKLVAEAKAARKKAAKKK